MAFSNEIGMRIAKLIERKDITQVELAKILNIKRETVSYWVSGKRDIKTRYTCALADYFNVTCDWILRGYDAEQKDIAKTTGLSEKAINKLEEINKRKARFIQNPL